MSDCRSCRGSGLVFNLSIQVQFGGNGLVPCRCRKTPIVDQSTKELAMEHLGGTAEERK